MNVLGLAWRSVRQRPLASILTTVSVALGVALTIAIMSLRQSAHTSYHQTARGYDAILGPTHGSPLQIVLNTMFHVGDAGGTVPWEVYEQAAADDRVKHAVPYAVGDMFRGHHVVGTTSALFQALSDAEKRPLGEGLRGSMFQDGKHFEAVVGSIAAAATKLKVGARFQVTHGQGVVQHGEIWDVVGVLRPTGTPADRAIFIPIETFYEVGDHKAGAEARRERRSEKEKEAAEDEEHGHAHDDEDGDHGHAHDGGGEGGDPDHGHEDGDEDPGHADGDHDEHGDAEDGHKHGTKEELGLSAVGIRLQSPVMRLRYVAEFRDDRATVQAVMPGDQIRQLFEIVGSVDRFFELTAWLIILVAGIGILVSLYNTIQGRRREIAILRALGARPRHVFTVIVLESLLLVLLGGVLGIVLGHAGITVAAPQLVERFGVLVSSGIGMLDLKILGVLALLGLAVGVLPAWRGLRTPVAENLYPTD